jgi:protein-L-isoaspartate O-methyltransferase
MDIKLPKSEEQSLVAYLKKRDIVKSEEVEDAMMSIQRHIFLEDLNRD